MAIYLFITKRTNVIRSNVTNKYNWDHFTPGKHYYDWAAIMRFPNEGIWAYGA